MSESVTGWSAPVRAARETRTALAATKQVDVFWVDDPLTGTRLHVSAGAQTWGVRADALCGVRDRWLAHVHPDDHVALRAAWDALAQGQAFAIEYRLLGSDHGEVREYRVRERGYLMPPLDGVPAHAVGLVEDVTQGQQTLAALAESE